MPYEGPGGTEIKWDTSVACVYWWYECTGRKHRYHKEKQNLIDASKEVGLEVNTEKTKSIVAWIPIARQQILTSNNGATGKWCSLCGACDIAVTQQYKNCWEWCFLCGPYRGYITSSSPCNGSWSIRGLNLAAVKHTTVQVTDVVAEATVSAS
jgi:hypothetical protein